MKLSNNCLIKFNWMNENLYCMDFCYFLSWLLTLIHVHFNDVINFEFYKLSRYVLWCDLKHIFMIWKILSPGVLLIWFLSKMHGIVGSKYIDKFTNIKILGT